MPYEIDYIPVGEGEKSGDAIAMRFGNNLATAPENQTVIVIDGGFEESGKALVQHIKDYYKTNKVDLLISTHPDLDHSSGLTAILEELDVKAILMHKPWEHADEIKNMFKDGRITASGLEEKLEKSLQSASDIEAIARKKNIPIYEPFQGMKLGDSILHILGPSEDYYKNLLPHFRSTPEPKKGFGIFAPVQKAAEGVIHWIEDKMDIDLIDDDDDTTSAENNTSTILLFEIDGHKILFTGDAGKTAILNAINYAVQQGISLFDLSFFDVPHHGSKHNLNSKILKLIKAQISYISAAKESPKHPAKKVTNALKKFGSAVYVNNKGGTLCHNHQGINRGWSTAQEEPFHQRVES